MNTENKTGMVHTEKEHEGDFYKGMLWATTLSIPLWVSFFGWINIIKIIIS